MSIPETQIPGKETRPSGWDNAKNALKALIPVVGIGGVCIIALVGLHRLAVDIAVPVGFLFVATLAYCNGANDVSKAIATLVGSGVTNYRSAIIYGSLCTLAGASISAFLAGGLVTAFTKGLIDQTQALPLSLALAAIAGSIAWVYLATRLALPVSTTHAITGAIVATGVLAVGANHVLWTNLGSKILLPLLLSPLIAFAAGLAVFWLLRRAVPGRKLTLVHWLSSGFASFTRGLNDTPKIVALAVPFVLAGGHTSTIPLWLFLMVACTMGLGSLIGGRKVTHTLAEKITRMNHQEGFAANLVTALLVGFSSPLSLPVSTTHISSCAILGVGLHKGYKQVRWHTVWEMVMAWVITLPVAGLLALVAALLLRPGF